MSFKEFFMEYIWQLPQNILGSLYKEYISDNIITRVNYDDTLAPEEYEEALRKTHYIEFNEWPDEENGGGV